MSWFVAHTVTLKEPVESSIKDFPCVENIILVKAKSLEEAIQKIKTIAQEEDLKETEIEIEKEVVVKVKNRFKGIKKITKLNIPEHGLSLGLPISRSYFKLKDEEAFEYYCGGFNVNLEYIGSAESEATNKRDNFKSNFPSFITNIKDK